MARAPAESAEWFIYGIENKRDWRRQVRYYTPPRLPASERDAIRDLALEAYRLLGCRDIARIDFRLNAAGQACFLECNPLPGLSPVDSDIVILSRGILAYRELVQGILLDAARRVGTSIG